MKMFHVYSEGNWTPLIEHHSDRRLVRAKVQHGRHEVAARMQLAIDRLRLVALEAIWEAEVRAPLVDELQLVAGEIVAEPVGPVFGEPQLVRPRIDRTADNLADADGREFGRRR